MLTNLQATKDDRIVAKCYVELGHVTKEKGEYDESLCYHRKSMEIFERIADVLSVAESHLNIAAVYKEKGELKQAINEYEKGLTLYEDVFLDDLYKNKDSNIDILLNSSSFSGRQCTRSLSKSYETLPRTTLINIIEKDYTSTSSLDMLASSTKNSSELQTFSLSMTSIDNRRLFRLEKATSNSVKSRSSSCTSDLQFINDNNMLSALSFSVIGCKPTDETKSEEIDASKTCMPCVTPLESIDQILLVSKTDSSVFGTCSEEIDNDTVSYHSCFPIERDSDRTSADKQEDYLF